MESERDSNQQKSALKMFCESLFSEEDKWRVSILAGLVFLLISSPLMYKITGSLGDCLNLDISNSKGCPTTLGLLLHTVVYVVITKLLMN